MKLEKRRSGHAAWLLALALIAWGPASSAGAVETTKARTSAALDTARIERLTGAKGTLDEREGVFKVSVPRPDLGVRVGGASLHPRLGLTSWAAFQPAGDAVMVMGDMVLLEVEVDPVLSAALDAGLEVTALHNHFLWDEPRVMFMHVGGHGPLDALASGVGAVFRAIDAASGHKAPVFALDAAGGALDQKAIEEALGAKGELADGVLKVTIAKTTRMHGQSLGAAMGVNTWAAFAGSDRQAVVD
ncbi:MAG: DUF1259 domain-containing protein, partial [Thermoanaerobaculia bacterium]